MLTPITFDIAASDGSTITYAVTDGTLPDGVTLTDGMISGTPTVSGNSEVRITATSGNASLEIVLSFSIQSAAEIEYLDSSYTGALNVNITYADGTTSGNLTANRRVGGTEVRWYSNDGYCLCGSGCCNSFSIWLGSQWYIECDGSGALCPTATISQLPLGINLVTADGYTYDPYKSGMSSPTSIIVTKA